MKPKANMRLYRLLDGEVAAGIVDGNGDLLDVKYFGKFTEAQYAGLMKVVEKHAARYTCDGAAGRAEGCPDQLPAEQPDLKEPGC